MIQATVKQPCSVGQEVLVTENVPCGMCGIWSRKRLYTERYELGSQGVELGINRCRGCGQVYVSPRLDRPSVQQVYRSDSERTISHHYCWTDRHSDERFTPLLNRLSAQVPDGRLLDIGCGSGGFLRAAESHGSWKLTGLEPCQTAAERARTRVHATIHPLTLEQAQLPAQTFDVVTLLGVLEHLHDPLATLHLVHRLLKPDGVLGLYVPNFHYLRWKDAGLVSLIRRQTWSCLAPQEHLFQFTPHSLAQLLHRSGFEVLRFDVGRPFLQGSAWQRGFKQFAYAATVTLHHWAGVHLGGIEVLARPYRRNKPELAQACMMSTTNTDGQPLP